MLWGLKFLDSELLMKKVKKNILKYIPFADLFTSSFSCSTWVADKAGLGLLADKAGLGKRKALQVSWFDGF